MGKRPHSLRFCKSDCVLSAPLIVCNSILTDNLSRLPSRVLAHILKLFLSHILNWSSLLASHCLCCICYNRSYWALILLSLYLCQFSLLYISLCWQRKFYFFAVFYHLFCHFFYCILYSQVFICCIFFEFVVYYLNSNFLAFWH